MASVKSDVGVLEHLPCEVAPLTSGLLKRAYFMSPKTNSGLPAPGSGLAFRFSRALVALALWLAVAGFAPLLRAVTFTGNVSISEGDTTYDGQDIIVDGATATINGAHSFTSLSLTRCLTRTDSPPPHRSA